MILYNWHKDQCSELCLTSKIQLRLQVNVKNVGSLMKKISFFYIFSLKSVDLNKHTTEITTNYKAQLLLRRM
jgi:hypothetical protein